MSERERENWTFGLQLARTYVGQLHLFAVINAGNASLAEANVRIVSNAICQECRLFGRVW